MSQLKITLVQPNVFWESIGANLAHLEEKLSEQDNGDVIILPEMFNTGFSMNAEKLAEPMNFNTFKWMKMQAAKYEALLIGSIMVKESGKYYNRCISMYPDGTFDTYDKAYLFRMMDENKHFTSGIKKKVSRWKGWNILPLICYDLRFPEWSRNAYNEGDQFLYDLLIFMGNWPTARIKAWDTLLQARAMENSCFLAGVNRIGEDGSGIDFNGHSAVIDPKGNYLLEPSEEEFVKTIELDLNDLIAYRKKFQVHLDWK